jgi:predicted nucleic acid-binding protein
LRTLFADTSAIARRYVAEVGSGWVLSWAVPAAGNVVVISELTTVEMFSLLARKQREGLLSANDIAQIQTTFLIHVEKEYLAIPLSRPVLAQARQLLVNYPLRTLDTIQLACAQDAVSTLNEPMTFISGDTNLLAAAAASEGFAADNSNLHP